MVPKRRSRTASSVFSKYMLVTAEYDIKGVYTISHQDWRKEMIPPDHPGSGFVCKAQPRVHIFDYVPVVATRQTDKKTNRMGIY